MQSRVAIAVSPTLHLQVGPTPGISCEAPICLASSASSLCWAASSFRRALLPCPPKPAPLSHRIHGNADAQHAGFAPTALVLDKGVAEERRPQQPPGTPDQLQVTAIASLKSDAPLASAVVAPLINEARASLKSEAGQARATQRQESARNDERERGA